MYSAVVTAVGMPKRLERCMFCAVADKHKHLSSSGVRGVIAGGIIGIICIAALALILKDLHGARKLQVRVAEP